MTVHNKRAVSFLTPLLIIGSAVGMNYTSNLSLATELNNFSPFTDTYSGKYSKNCFRCGLTFI
jgi:hypothetical protein